MSSNSVVTVFSKCRRQFPVVPGKFSLNDDFIATYTESPLFSIYTSMTKILGKTAPKVQMYPRTPKIQSDAHGIM